MASRGNTGGGAVTGGSSVTCYVAGSRIQTERGEVPVEEITPGIRILVLRDEQEVFEPVIWTGKLPVDLSSHAHIENAAPIRIKAHAVADNRPCRDLLVSPEHCIILQGLCIPAKLLVNGASIVSERQFPPFTYYHIELERHGVVLAENLPAETYLDTGNRSAFAAGSNVSRINPCVPFNASASRWETDACAPLARNLNDVERIWQELADRAVQIGYSLPIVQTVDDPTIHLVADGKIIRPTSSRVNRHTFVVPAGVQTVMLGSRFGIPADRMMANRRDVRRLGIRVTWFSIKSGSDEVFIPADHPELSNGWHDVEKDNISVWRWTNGMAEIPLSEVTGPRVITINCSPLDAYPSNDEPMRLAG